MPCAACTISFMQTKMLIELGGSRVKLPKGRGLEAEIRVMGWEKGATAVEGSSADYPVDAIKRDFAEAFPKGTRMRANHDGVCEAGGDIRRIIAKTTGVPVIKEDHPDGPGAYAPAIISEDWSTFMREFGDTIGVSISAGCEIAYEAATDEDGEPILDHENKPVMIPKLSERGAYIVERFLTQEESPYNSIDFVEAPGADGRIVSLAIESARTHLGEMTTSKKALREAAQFAIGTIKPPSLEEDSEATPPRSNKEEDMTPEERAALVAEAATAGAAAALEQFRAGESAPEQSTLGVLAEAVITAGLTEAGRTEVYARVGRGETLESAIAAETAREASIEAEVARRVEAAQATRATEGVFGFGYTTDDVTGPSLKGESSKVDQKKVNEDFDALMSEEV